jgi:DNA-binding transcriptional regulator YhcF (GntR family)
VHAPVSRQPPIPLHLQIRQLLLDSIESGELHPGERLLQEREIAAKYDLNLAPVRQAWDDVAELRRRKYTEAPWCDRDSFKGREANSTGELARI